MITLTTFNGLIQQAKEMNVDIDVAFSILSSNKQPQRLRDLLQKAKPVQFFEEYKPTKHTNKINLLNINYHETV